MTARNLSITALAACSLALTACGSNAPDPNQTKAERGVVTSAFECPELLKVEMADCEKAIEEAKALHSRKAPTYRSEAKCEETEGKGRCERSGQESFSPRLQAFLITATKRPKAAPLYPSKEGKAGFAEGGGNMILTDSEKIKFSDEAYDLGELNATPGG